MNISFDKNITSQSVGVSLVSDSRALDSFLDPYCSAAIWAREVPLKTQNWIDFEFFYAVVALATFESA